MAVNSGYKKRTMRELAEEALVIIIRQPGLGCGVIGDELFKGNAYIKGSAPYARLVGKVMKLLEADGLAYRDRRGWQPRVRAVMESRKREGGGNVSVGDTRTL